MANDRELGRRVLKFPKKLNPKPIQERAADWFSALRQKTRDAREQLRETLSTTSEQVLEKAEETRRAVKLRMAILEIEHHLNRLYPQIGKLICDRLASGNRALLKDKDIKGKVELAEEYRQRLEVLKQELEAHSRTLSAKE